MDRLLFHWNVQIADAENGGTGTEEFACYWSPEKVSADSVAIACAAQATVTARRKFLPISAELVQLEPEVAA